MLANLPAGLSVFVDTNIFLYHFLGYSASCTAFFARARRREILAYTSTIVLTEVFHQLMLSEVGERHPLMPGGALRMLRRHPEMIATLAKAPTLIRKMRQLRVRILPLRWQELRLATELSQRYHLLATDSIIVGTIQTHGLRHLVSNDTDFTRVPDLTLWRP